LSSAATNASTTIGGTLSYGTTVRRSPNTSPIRRSFASVMIDTCLGW
jgi:hypothetical protein